MDGRRNPTYREETCNNKPSLSNNTTGDLILHKLDIHDACETIIFIIFYNHFIIKFFINYYL